MNLRFRYKLLGSHVHVRVFGSLVKSDHMALCGTLVFREREWQDLMPMLDHLGFDCIDETQPEEASK